MQSSDGQETGRPAAILIAGPTASGKSALGSRIARAFGGAVINTDSMQVYADLRALSASVAALGDAGAMAEHVDAIEIGDPPHRGGHLIDPLLRYGQVWLRLGGEERFPQRIHRRRFRERGGLTLCRPGQRRIELATAPSAHFARRCPENQEA